MATNTNILNMMKSPRLNVVGDFAPWGEYLNDVRILQNAKVISVEQSVGIQPDTCELEFPNNVFGEEEEFFKPIKIVAYDGENENTNVHILYRGFLLVNKGTIDASSEVQTAECKDYKWFLSRLTTIRGKIYTLDGTTPVFLGNGRVEGDANKLRFEKFRFEISDKYGYLQDDECIFNKDGMPDCYVDNRSTSALALFYLDTVTETEINGVESTAKYVSKDWNGFYWSWATMLNYIQKYWIDPYISDLVPVEIHQHDLNRIKDIDSKYRYPINFSIEGMSPMAAIDKIVSAMPGRWNWYIDYLGNTVKIRIRELKSANTGDVNLVMCDGEDKLYMGKANTTSASVVRDVSEAARFAIAKAGKIKLVTTMKLIPLWQTQNGDDFIDEDDVKQYKEFIKKYYSRRASNEDFSIDMFKMPKEDVYRYAQMYRLYGIPQNAANLKTQFLSNGISLDGKLISQYQALTTDVFEMLFDNVRIKREYNAPEFGRYSDNIVVFMHDSYRGMSYRESDGTEVKPSYPGTGSISDNEKEEAETDLKWVVPDRDGVSYKFDENNGVILFDEPQFKIGGSGPLHDEESLLTWIPMLSYDDTFPFASRDVYMTVTIDLDISSIVGQIIPNRELNFYNGPHFSIYQDLSDNPITIHQDAWYPITNDNKDEVVISYSEETMDGKTLGRSIRKCDSFDNYKKYIGDNGKELLRAVYSIINKYDVFQESVDATLPYLELGPDLLDRLTRIKNTKYQGLRSYLLKIVWSRDGDSDNMITKFTFGNVIDGNTSMETAYIFNKSDRREKQFTNRLSFNIINEELIGE